jgi:hypothetical protein
MFNDLFNGVAGLAFLVLAVLVFWKYSQIWAVSVATKIIQIYFDQKRAHIIRGSGYLTHGQEEAF